MEEISVEYKSWLRELKSKISSTQIKAAIAVNSALITFYWDLGKMISEKEALWGSKLIERLSIDLKLEFPEMKGLSLRNLQYARQFYQFYAENISTDQIAKQLVSQIEIQIGQQPVDQFESSSELVQQPVGLIAKQLVSQLPWGHNILIFKKLKNIPEAKFYIEQTIENNWSRDVLASQIKSDLYRRKGKAITNFKNTLPAPMSDLAEQTLKDPYIFDFMAMEIPYKERDIENQLIKHITNFLLELGKGFAFMGQQFHLEIAENDYYIDLLFYHTRLKCYVVVELKNTRFIPEYAGKLNFYLSAVDSMVKQADDKPTIGLLLCRDKNNIEAEFALRDINKPIGISEFQLTEILPDDLKSSLPTIEEIEQELKNL